MKTEAIAPVSVDVRDIDSSDDEDPAAWRRTTWRARRGPSSRLSDAVRREARVRAVALVGEAARRRRGARAAHDAALGAHEAGEVMARVVAARGERWSRNRGGRGAGGDALQEARRAPGVRRVARRRRRLGRGGAREVELRVREVRRGLASRRARRHRAAGEVPGGTDADTRRRIVADAAAAADRSAGAFDVEDILGGARRARSGSSPRPRPNSRTTRAARRTRSRCEPRRFCSARPRAARPGTW